MARSIWIFMGCAARPRSKSSIRAPATRMNTLRRLIPDIIGVTGHNSASWACASPVAKETSHSWRICGTHAFSMHTQLRPSWTLWLAVGLVRQMASFPAFGISSDLARLGPQLELHIVVPGHPTLMTSAVSTAISPAVDLTSAVRPFHSLPLPGMTDLGIFGLSHLSASSPELCGAFA